MKRILKQKSHPYEFHNKRNEVIKTIFSMLVHKVIFCIFSTKFNKETIKTISKYWVKLPYHLAWASEGGQGDQGPPLDCENFRKKVVFIVSSEKKQISPFLAPL